MDLGSAAKIGIGIGLAIAYTQSPYGQEEWHHWREPTEQTAENNDNVWVEGATGNSASANTCEGAAAIGNIPGDGEWVVQCGDNTAEISMICAAGDAALQAAIFQDIADPNIFPGDTLVINTPGSKC